MGDFSYDSANLASTWYSDATGVAGTVSVGECYVNNADLHLEANTLLDFTNQITRTKANHQVSGTTNEFGTDVGFEDDYTVTYYHADAAGNVASPVTRRVVVKDTVPPTLKLDGDCVIQNSAGAHAEGYHDAADNNSTCADYNAGASNDDHGLFDHDGVARFFRHSDFCDRTVHTKVSLWAAGSSSSGVCNWVTDKGNSATNNRCHVDVTTPVKTGATRLPCVYSAAVSGRTADECFLGVFVWGGVETEAGQKPAVAGAGGTSNKLYSSSTYDSRHQKFREYQAGTYAVVYETTDRSGLKASACREIENVDHTYPIIQILGSDQMTLEATHQGNYIDDGATCSDQVDGVISQNVEVSGDVVNLSKVGTYTITYNCKDSANNAAPAARRTVVVAQTSCPRCHVFGEDEINHEASFPYADAGAACSDVIDGTTTTKCYTTNAASADTAVSCEGSTLVDVETTGTYTIQYRSTNTVGLWNDGTNCRGGPISYYRTVVVMDTLRPVISLKYDNGDTNSLVARGTKGNNDGNAVGGGQGANGEVTNDIHDTSTGAYPSGTMDSLYSAELNGQFVDPGTHLPTLMAEESTSSVNGCVVGAIASAVAGLALLGYSTRRTAVATSVPV